MDQILFVLKDGKISQWNLSRGKLEAVKSLGLLQVPYSAETAKAYWDGWKEDNQVVDGDVYDAIFLSDDEDLLSTLPPSFTLHREERLSRWTIKQLSLLSRESDFVNRGIYVIQENLRHTLSPSSSSDDELIFFLRSTCGFSLDQRIFFLLPEKSCVSLFEQCENELKLKPIAGEKSVQYQLGKVKDCMLEITETICREYSLNPRGGFLIALIENENLELNEVFNREGEFLFSIPLSRLVCAALSKLRENKELKIDEYGVNFDGIQYRFVDGEVKIEGDFNLYSYTLNGEMLVDLARETILEIVRENVIF